MQQETNLTQLTTENSEELRKNIELFRQIFNLIISDPQFSSGYHYTKVVNLIETYGPQPWSQIEEMITSNSANTRKELIEFISGIRQGYFEILYRMESKLNIQSRMEKVSDAFNVKRSNGIILSFSPKIEEAISKNKLLKRPLEDLDMNVRTYNALKSANIRCLGHIVLCSEPKLLKIPNLGNLTLQDIKELVHRAGLKLRMSEVELIEFVESSL